MDIRGRLKNLVVARVYLDFTRQYAGYAGLGLLATLIVSVAKQAPPVMFGLALETLSGEKGASEFPFVESILASGDASRIGQIALIAIVSVLIVITVSSVEQYYWRLFQEKTRDVIREAGYDAVQSLHPRRFVEESTGTYLSVIDNDVDLLGNFPQYVFARVANDFTRILTAGFILLTLNWQFAVITLFTLPLIAVLTYRFNDAIEPKYEAEREQTATLTGRLSTSINGVMTVRSYSAEDEEREKVSDASSSLAKAKIDSLKTRILFGYGFDIISRGVNLLVLILGAFWVLNGPPLVFTQELTAGELAVFFTNTGLFIRPLISVRRYIDTYRKSKSAAERLYGIIDAGEKDRLKDGMEFDSASGAVDFDDVEFSYSFDTESVFPEQEEEDGGEEETDKDTDDDTDDDTDRDNQDRDDDTFTLGPVSCRVESGEMIGIVGPSGSGKSTFMKLLMRFMQPDTGQLRIGGTKLEEYNARSYRDTVGYVSQQPYMFDGTLRDNIAYGRPDATDQEIQDAVEMAVLEDVVDSLEDGLQTTVGNDGAKLSGGEKQRVAVARALITKPNLLILDEATSHVDNITESKIQQSIENASSDRTTFAIAHRLSTVRNADKILVIEDGSITERGTHDELLEVDGLYAALWRRHVGRQ